MTRLRWQLVLRARELGGRIPRGEIPRLLAGELLAAQTEGFARRGYAFFQDRKGALRLETAPRRLFAEEISCELGTDLVGRRVETHWRVGSTNDIARERARDGREGVAVFAEEQTHGRGRFGGRWHAPRFSSLLFSVPLHSRGGSIEPEGLMLAGAVAVAEAIREEAGLGALIRWPNDVLLEDKKVSGVVVEGFGPPEDRWFIVGVGVNVNAKRLPPELQREAASICDLLGRDADRVLLARADRKSVV